MKWLPKLSPSRKGAGSLYCPICTSSSIRRYTRAGKLDLLRCADCTVTSRPMSRIFLKSRSITQPITSGVADWSTSDYVGEEVGHRIQSRQYLGLIRLLSTLPCSILDIGCAAGFFIDEARKRGCTVFGCDVSGYAVEYARDTLQL